MKFVKSKSGCGKLLVVLFVGMVLSACAPVQDSQRKNANRIQLVFPSPPDDPRFVYERTIVGSADVTQKKSDSELKLMLTGQRESSEGLGKPYGVAVHKGRIFVSDSAERFIKVFDVPTGKYFTFGDGDQGSLIGPLGLDVDAAGNVYVADGPSRTIMIFDRDGKFLRKLGGPKWIDRLSSVTADPAGQRVFAVDIGGVSSENHRVRVFDALTGNHLFDIGKRGNGPGEFNLPRDAAIGKNGHIYVVDGGNFRVQIFDANGKYLQSFGSVGKQMGNFARPKEIAIDPDGNVYVVDAAFGNFQIFNAEGELLMFVGDRSEINGPARYMLPSGIAVDEDGRIYVVDQWFKKVDIFRPHNLSADAGYLGQRARPLVGR